MVSDEHYTRVSNELVQILNVELECSGCVHHLRTGHDIVLLYGIRVIDNLQDMSPVLKEEVIAEITAVILERYGRGGS